MHLVVGCLNDRVSRFTSLSGLDCLLHGMVDSFYGISLHFSNCCFLRGLGRLDLSFSRCLNSMDCFDSVLQSVLKGLGLLSRYFGGLLTLSSLAFESSDDKLDLLLNDLSFHLSNGGVLLMDSNLGLLLSIKTVHDSQSGLQIVLVYLDLSKVGIHDLHGVLTGRGEGHHVVPMLNEHLAVLLSQLLLLHSDIRVLDSSPEEPPARQSSSSIERRALVDRSEVSIPNDPLAG